MERNAFEGLGRPIVEDQAFDGGALVEEDAVRAIDGRDLAEVERHEPPALGEKLEQIGKLLGGDLFFEPLGHERFLGGDELFDIVAEEADGLAFGIDQLDGGLGLGGEEAVDGAAVGGGDGVGDEVAFDAPARVKDVDQELGLGMSGHACEVWADLASLAAMHVALAALLFEDELSPGGVTRLEDGGCERVDHLLAVGVGQAAAAREELLGASREGAVGVIGEGLFLVEGEHVDPQGSLFDTGEEGQRPVVAAEEGAEGVGAGRGGERGEGLDQGGGDIGGLRGGERLDQAGGEGRGGARGDQGEDVLSGGEIIGLELDQLGGGGGAGGVGGLGVAGGGEEGAGDLGGILVEALAAEAMAEADERAAGIFRKPGQESGDRLFLVVAQLRGFIFGPAGEEALNDGVKDGAIRVTGSDGDEQRPDRVHRPAARVVLGDVGDDSDPGSGEGLVEGQCRGRLEELVGILRGGGGEGVEQPSVSGCVFAKDLVSQGAGDLGRSRLIGEREQRGEADMGVAIAQELRIEDRSRGRRVAREDGQGIAPHTRRGMRERGESGLRGPGIDLRQRSEAVKSRCRAWIAAGFRPRSSTAGSSTSLTRSSTTSRSPPAHDQQAAAGVRKQPGEHVVIFQRGDELRARSWDRASSSRQGFASL